MEEDWGGCLSVPGMHGIVPRYAKIRYQGVDQHRNTIDRSVEGFHARVVQHECDHLNGILFVDKVKNTTSYMTTTEYRKMQRALKKREPNL